MVAHHPDAEHPAHIPELHTTQQHLQHLPLFAKVLSRPCSVKRGCVLQCVLACHSELSLATADYVMTYVRDALLHMCRSCWLAGWQADWPRPASHHWSGARSCSRWSGSVTVARDTRVCLFPAPLPPLTPFVATHQTGRMSGRGVGDTLRAIYQSEGPRGFFRCSCSGLQECQCHAVSVRGSRLLPAASAETRGSPMNGCREVTFISLVAQG